MTVSDSDIAVSVVMPLFNAAEFVEESLTSVLSQTGVDFEVVAVDDGSTDGTPEMLAKFAASDSRVRVIRQPNAGIVAALNLGIKHARGRYIARADGDDLYEPERFALQLAYLKAHPEVAVVCCDYRLSYPDGSLVQVSLPQDSRSILKRLFFRNEIMHSSVMMRRDLLVAAGGYLERWRHLEDYELWFRLALHGEIASIPKQLAIYRLNANSISKAKESYQVRQSLLLRGEVLLRRQVPIAWSRYLLKHLLKALIPATLLRSHQHWKDDQRA